MTGNFSERNVAFQHAEAALIRAELFLQEQDFQQRNFYSGGACNATTCFYSEDSGVPVCDDGLCFIGSFEPAKSCELTPILDQENEVFQSAETWRDNSGMHRTLDLNGDGEVDAKFIIEFRCFAVKNPMNPASDQFDSSNEYIPSYWEPFYRITALGNGRNVNTRVMLQSSYRRE